ncbi:MAG: SpaH/EbpB family LPXTG-anchored major pilin [Defluviitaleaceae bacterium]|nr:SpaH/EbpB family LPXTG-anchored major pilin [Defluviitaleaceae bacterium]
MIKKIIKSVAILAFACMLCVQGTMPILAQPNVSGIDPNQPGSITINRFAGTTAVNPTEGTPLNGIPYTIELVRLRPGTPQTAEHLRHPENFEPVEGAEAFSATNSTVNGVAHFPGLPHGIFLVTEGEHAVTPVEDRVAPFIVGIPRRSADDESWIYDVVVYPKSEADTILDLNKELDLAWHPELEAMVATWTLETTIPRLIGNATRLEFVDSLDPRLTLVPGSVVGTYLRMAEVGGVLTATETTLPTTAFDYHVDSNRVLTIGLTQEGFNHLGTHAVLAPEGRLTFHFETTLATDEAYFGPLTNEATLYYNEEDGVTTAVPPTDMLFGIEVEKVDVTGALLDGAVFELFLDEDGNIPALIGANGDNLRFTTVNGRVMIPNLQAGTYYLQEVESPEGFRLISNLMPVRVGANYVTEEGRNHVVIGRVVNEVEGGFVLPETGGVGTMLFTVVGLALIGGALSLILIAKRRRDDQHG